MAFETQAAAKYLAQNVAAASGTIGTVDIRNYTAISVTMNLTALTGGTAPTVQLAIDRRIEDGAVVPNWEQIVAPTAISAVGTSRADIGPGLVTSTLPGKVIRLRWVTTGGPATAVADFAIIGLPEY